MGCAQDVVEGGLRVKLLTTSGQMCQTAGLDNTEQRDYQQGQAASFSTAEDGMENCENFPAGGLTGGTVTWTGSGVFAARSREICAQLSAEEALQTWCCTMDDAASAQNVQVSLSKCALVVP